MGVYQTSRRGTNAKKHQRLATDYLCPVAAPDPAGPRQPIWSGWRARAFPLGLPRLQLTAEPGPHYVAVGSTQRQLGPGGEKDRVFAVERRLQLPILDRLMIADLWIRANRAGFSRASKLRMVSRTRCCCPRACSRT